MNDLYLKILKEGYDVKLYGGKRTRTGFVCKTDKGMKEVRKCGNDILRLSVEGKLREHMKNKGFNISTFEESQSGDMFYEFNGTKYVLEESIQGEELDFSNYEGALLGAKSLALFHNCAEGFCSDIMKNDAYKIPDTFLKRYSELKRIRRRIKESRKYSPIDMIVVKNFDMVSEMVDMSLDILKKYNYDDLKEEYKKRNTVCHNAYKGDNVRLLDNGDITVTNIDRCTYNFTVKDLSDFIIRLIKSEVFSKDQILTILAEYEKVRNIEEKERYILKAFLIFPHKFLSICNEYYNKRSVCISDAMLERFEKSAIMLKNNMEFAKNLWKNIEG